MVTDGGLRRLAQGVYVVPDVMEQLICEDPEFTRGWDGGGRVGPLAARGRRSHPQTQGPAARTVPHPPVQLAWAGVLRAGVPSAVGGWHALLLNGVRVWPTHLSEPTSIWVTGERSLARGPMWRFRRDGAGRLEWVAHGMDVLAAGLPGVMPPPTIPLADAAIDVARELPASEAIGVVLDALATRRLPPEIFAKRLRERRMVRHRDLLESVASDFCGGVHSMLEHRYTTDVERAHDLPAPTRQRVMPGGGVDVLYEDLAVVIELDGRAFHTDLARDAARDNANALSGLRTLRFGWVDVTSDPCRVADQVSALLQRSGWNGAPGSCSLCHAARHAG